MSTNYKDCITLFKISVPQNSEQVVIRKIISLVWQSLCSLTQILYAKIKVSPQGKLKQKNGSQWQCSFNPEWDIITRRNFFNIKNYIVNNATFKKIHSQILIYISLICKTTLLVDFCYPVFPPAFTEQDTSLYFSS